MSVSEPGKIITPWAESGLKNTIPPAANPATGRAGFDQGFSAINMTAKEAGGIPPFGQDFNGIFYEVTNILRYMQAGGQPTFDSALATAIGGYPKGAMVLGNDGTSVYKNIVDSNSSNPNSGGSGWAREDLMLREALRRSYAEAGYTLVSGSFEQGGTLTRSSDVLLFESDGKGYSWGGTLPKVVPQGSTPTTSGGIGAGAWVDRTDQTLRQEITAFSGKLTPSPAWSDVPAHSDDDLGTPLNAQALALAERTEYLGFRQNSADVGTIAELIGTRILATKLALGFFTLTKVAGTGTASSVSFSGAQCFVFDSSGQKFELTCFKTFYAEQFGFSLQTDWFAAIYFCAKNGLVFEFSGGNTHKYTVKYTGSGIAIAASDMKQGFGINGDAGFTENVTTQNHIELDFTIQTAVLFQASGRLWIGNLCVTAKTQYYGVLAASPELGGSNFTDWGDITAIGLYQPFDIQRLVYFKLKSIRAAGCYLGPYISSKNAGSPPYIWNDIGANGWFNNLVEIGFMICTDIVSIPFKMVCAGAHIGFIDVSRCAVPAEFGATGHPNNGAYIIESLYDEINTSSPIFKIFDANTFVVHGWHTVEGNQSAHKPLLIAAYNCRNVDIASPVHNGFADVVVHADNSKVKISGDSRNGALFGYYTTANGGKVCYEPLKIDTIVENITLPTDGSWVDLVNNILEDKITLLVDAIVLENGTSFAVSQTVTINMGGAINGNVIGLSQIKIRTEVDGTGGYKVTARNTSSTLSASIRSANIRTTSMWVM